MSDATTIGNVEAANAAAQIAAENAANPATTCALCAGFLAGGAYNSHAVTAHCTQQA